MKKLLLLATLVGIAGMAQATTIVVSTNSVLEGNSAYSWGISIAVPTGQTVTSAEIDFSKITLAASGNSQGTGVLYTDLLNSKTGGETTRTDNDAAGDYWKTQFSGANLSSVGTNGFAFVGQTLSWSLVLNSTELLALNNYLLGGTFNIGLDPDCKFNVGGITFTYTTGTTTHNTVPETSTTAVLLLLGLGGMEVFRRSVFAAKAKARA